MGSILPVGAFSPQQCGTASPLGTGNPMQAHHHHHHHHHHPQQAGSAISHLENNVTGYTGGTPTAQSPGQQFNPLVGI